MIKYLYIPLMNKALGLLFMAWILVIQVEAQPVIGIRAVAGCEGFDVLVPIEVEDFFDIAAITLYITVDTSTFDYLGIEDPNESLSSGQLVSNLVAGEPASLNLSWTGNSAAEIQSGVLCYLKVHLKSAAAEFVLSEDSELAHSDFTVITDVVYHSGAIEAWDNWIPQPGIAAITKGQSVSFVLPSLQNLSYQWQVAEGDRWNDLADGDHFMGTQTPELNIVEALLSFNNMQFRCLLSTQQCIQTSQEALLTVNTLGISDIESKTNMLVVYPNPFDQHLEYKVGEAIHDGQIRLSDIQGKIYYQSVPNELLAGSVHNIPVDGLSGGFYVLSLYQDGKIIATQKVIKKH